MEEILLNVDSRYRNNLLYPNESKYKYTFDKKYKNIISARMISIEVYNTISYFNDIKQNNYITVHLPNKLNDPNGTQIILDKGLYQDIAMIKNTFDNLFNQSFNLNSSLKKSIINNKAHAEKYFYFLYLNENVELTFDFNNVLFEPSTLATKLTLNKGWYSIYGIVLQIQDYITTKHNERVIFKNTNPSNTSVISLDSGNFILNEFILPIFDRRFRHVNKLYDCIRFDTIGIFNGLNNNLTNNLNLLKNYVYTIYINDITSFVLQTTYDNLTGKLLDKLNTGNYLMTNAPDTSSYTILAGNLLESKSIYHLNIAYNSVDPVDPIGASTQIYNLKMETDLSLLKVSFSNDFSDTSSYKFYYYFTPVPGSADPQVQTWNKTDSGITINLFNKLFNDKNFAYEQNFITQAQRDDIFFVYTSEKDIADFEIDFTTNISNSTSSPEHISNGLVDIKQMTYPSLGYYLGFRPDTTKTTDLFLFNITTQTNTKKLITGQKIYDTNGDDYIFLKINNWGYLDFFNEKLFAKILLSSNLGGPKIDEYVNKEFRFRQPIDINKLDIELVDYLGNTIDLYGFNWSFTIEFKQIINTNDKKTIQREALVFNNT